MTRTVASAVFLFLIFCFFTGSIEYVVPDKRSLSREEFKKALSTKGLKFVHQNICGFEQKFDELQEFVETDKGIDIISLSETHLIDRI